MLDTNKASNSVLLPYNIGPSSVSDLAIGVADAERAGRLLGPHRGPFGRMLIAQALARDLAVVSVDAVFDRYGVNRL